jgi:hypothetical protein
MRSRTAAALALVVVTAAGCSGVTFGSAGQASPAAKGPFVLPASACDLLTPAAVERVAGRSSVRLTTAGAVPTGSTAVVTCGFTDGLVPVGLLTVDVHPATAGRSAAQELDDSVAGSLYQSTTSDAVPGLGDAAKYGSALSVGGLHYATVWTVTLGGGAVGDLTLTVASRTPQTARPALVELARRVLAAVQGHGGPATTPAVPSTPAAVSPTPSPSRS